MTRVVVTGLNIISPVGYNIDKNWSSILNGDSWISSIKSFDTSDFDVKVAGELNISDDDSNFFDAIVDKRAKKRMDNFLYYGLLSAIMAFNDSDLQNFVNSSNNNRFGVFMTSGIGGLSSIEEASLKLANKGTRLISPFFLPSILINLLPGNIAIKLGLKGPNFSHVSACASSANAIGEAFEMIKSGRVDACLAGGSEFAVCNLGITAFNAMKALSVNQDPVKASRPLDKARDGFVMSNGSACLVLENYDHAIKRGVKKIYGEIVGYGASCDASHITAPDQDGIGVKYALEQATAGFNINDIDYINLHATSTPVGDIIELNSMYNFLGKEKSANTFISATKSITGHALGAIGAIEAIITLLALKDQIVPPTINLDNPEEITNNFKITTTKTNANLKYAISNSFGFGGSNACLFFKKFVP